MNKDLIIIDNNNSKTSSTNKDEKHNSLSQNRTSNKFSTRNSNSIDFGGDDAPNYNDDDSFGSDDYSNGNFYQDDSDDFYSKGTVYNNDFNEDYPDINNQFKQKLYEDIKKSYKETNKPKTEEDEFKDLELDVATSPKFFELINNDVNFETGRVLFKSDSFNNISPEYRNIDYHKAILTYFIVGFISLLLIITIPFTNLPLLTLPIFSLIFILCVLNSIYYSIKKAFTKHFLVLDYNKNLFYYETKIFFKQKFYRLFSFKDIAEIGVSYESKYENYDNKTSIYFLLNNGDVFKLFESDRIGFDGYTYYKNYYKEIAKRLSYALKKPYFNNPNRLKLYKSNSDNEGCHFSFSPETGEELHSFEDLNSQMGINTQPSVLTQKIDSFTGFIAIVFSFIFIVFLLAFISSLY